MTCGGLRETSDNPWLLGVLGSDLRSQLSLLLHAVPTVAPPRAVERDKPRPGVDTEWIGDLLTGPLLMRVFLPTGPIDENLVRVTVDAALSALAQAPE